MHHRGRKIIYNLERNFAAEWVRLSAIYRQYIENRSKIYWGEIWGREVGAQNGRKGWVGTVSMLKGIRGRDAPTVHPAQPGRLLDFGEIDHP